MMERQSRARSRGQTVPDPWHYGPELPAVVRQMKERFKRVTPRLAMDSWSAAYILMGLRYEEALIQTLLRAVAAIGSAT